MTKIVDLEREVGLIKERIKRVKIDKFWGNNYYNKSF